MIDAKAQQVASKSKALTSGLFIALEGGDGAGKTSVMELVQEQLQGKGANVLFTREPGATELGQQLRQLVMHGPEDVDPRTEALLYAADRAYHVANMIRPALESGQSVITDRYIDSSVAYQGIGRALGEDAVRDLSLWATDNLVPDAVLFFDVDPKVGLSRLGKTLDRLEQSGSAFHRRVHQYYLEQTRLQPERYFRIDANRSLGEVVEQTLSALEEIFSRDQRPVAMGAVSPVSPVLPR